MLWPLFVALKLIAPPGGDSPLSGSGLFRVIRLFSLFLLHFGFIGLSANKKKKFEKYRKLLLTLVIFTFIKGYFYNQFNLNLALSQFYVYITLIYFIAIGTLCVDDFFSKINKTLIFIFYIGLFFILYSKDIPGPKYFMLEFAEEDFVMLDRHTNTCAYYLRYYILCWPVIFFHAYIKELPLFYKFISFLTMPIFIVVNFILFKFRSDLIYTLITVAFFVFLLSLTNKKKKVGISIFLSMPILFLVFIFFNKDILSLQSRFSESEPFAFRFFEIYSWFKSASGIENIVGRGLGTSYNYARYSSFLGQKVSTIGNTGFHLGFFLPMLHGGIIFLYVIVIYPLFIVFYKMSNYIKYLSRYVTIELALFLTYFINLLTVPVLAEMDRVFQISFQAYAIGVLMAYSKLSHYRVGA